MTPIEPPKILSQREAAQFMGISPAKLRQLERNGLAKLPGVEGYTAQQLQAYVQFLTDEQAKGWTVPSREEGEREDHLRLLTPEPGRRRRRSRKEDRGSENHPLERRIDAA